MLKKHKPCGDMQNLGQLLQFNDVSVQSITYTLPMGRESRCGQQRFQRQNLLLRGMVVAHHEHQWRVFSAFQIHLQEVLVHGCANHDTEGKRFKSPIHCCDVTNRPYLFSGELCTSPLHCKLLFVYTVCCRRTRQCFFVLRTRKSDVILTQWTAVVGEVTSLSSDTMCHSCAPVSQVISVASDIEHEKSDRFFAQRL